MCVKLGYFGGPVDRDHLRHYPQSQGTEAPVTRACPEPIPFPPTPEKMKSGHSDFPRQKPSGKRQDFLSIPSQNLLTTKARRNCSSKGRAGSPGGRSMCSRPPPPHCLSRAPLQLESFSSCSPKCVFWCRMRLELREKCFPHRVHLYGFSPLCVLWCAPKLEMSLKVRPHSVHS